MKLEIGRFYWVRGYNFPLELDAIKGSTVELRKGGFNLVCPASQIVRQATENE